MEFPPNFDPLARDLIERLLVPEPERRLGAGGFSEIKSHPYFQSSSGCWNGEFAPKRLLPPLQELCARAILKKFHSILVEAGDAVRSDGDTSQAGRDKDERSGSRGALSNGDSKPTIQENGDDVSPTTCQSVEEKGVALTSPSAGSIGKEAPSSSKSSYLEGFSEKQKQELLDQMISRSLRELPQEEMPRHLRLLVDRMEFAVDSFSAQLARECALAEKWRQEQQAASDSSSSCSADDDEQAATNELVSGKREDGGDEATACSVTES